MKTGRTCRGGFSLIEVLAVMGIMALLAALAVGTYMRLRGSTTENSADESLGKIHSSLADRWNFVLDQASREVREGTLHPDVMTVAKNDKELARVIWTYLKLKNEFPTTRVEATTDIQLKVGAVNGVGGTMKTVLKHKPVFNSLPVLPPAAYAIRPENPFPLETESSACLYLALRNTGSGGITVGGEGLEQHTGTSQSGPVFLDPFGMPIAFVRMAYTVEANNPPYLKGTPTSRDPLDPQGRLINRPTALPSSFDLASFWTTVWSNHIGTQGGVGGNSDWPGSPIPDPYASNAIGTANWLPTLVSAGLDKRFRVVPADNPTTPPPPSWLIGNDDRNGDNRLSYRVRAGQKGL